MTPDPKAQMLANAMAVMRLRWLDLGEPVRVDTDRVWWVGSGDTLVSLYLLVRHGYLDYSTKSGHRVPAELLDALGCYKATEARCLRGRIKGSLAGDQWVAYCLYDHDDLVDSILLEMDIDEESPVDVAGAVLHWCRLWWRSWTGAKTDPFAMAQRLRDAGIEVA